MIKKIAGIILVTLVFVVVSKPLCAKMNKPFKKWAEGVFVPYFSPFIKSEYMDRAPEVMVVLENCFERLNKLIKRKNNDATDENCLQAAIEYYDDLLNDSSASICPKKIINVMNALLVGLEQNI